MSKPKRLDELITALLNATECGRLAWVQTVDDDCYSVSFSESSVSVTKPDDEVIITFLNGNGRSVWEHQGNSQELNDLYAAARRVAMDADKLLDAMLAEIGALK